MINNLTRRHLLSPKSLFFSAVFLLSISSMGQGVVSPLGTNLQNSENQISITVGEPVTPTLQSGSVILTQGFQQAKLIITAISNPGQDDLNFSVGPNPTDDYLDLSSAEDISKNSKFILTDLNGNIIQTGPIESRTTRISFLSLPSGAYLLKVFLKQNQAPITYKILKK